MKLKIRVDSEVQFRINDECVSIYELIRRIVPSKYEVSFDSKYGQKIPAYCVHVEIIYGKRVKRWYFRNINNTRTAEDIKNLIIDFQNYIVEFDIETINSISEVEFEL